MIYFGQFIRELRTIREIPLREFCRSAELDPSNWSKVERDIASPPKSRETLNRIVKGLSLDLEETKKLYDLALICSIPEDLRPPENVLSKLPLFIRTMRGEKPTDEELRDLIEKLSLYA